MKNWDAFPQNFYIELKLFLFFCDVARIKAVLLQIEKKKDSPRVGKNLQDHLNFPVYVTTSKTVSYKPDDLSSLTSLWHYWASKSG